MTSAIWSVSLTLGCCLLCASSEATDCTHYATVGKRYEVPLVAVRKPEHRLTWTKSATKVYDSKRPNDFTLSVTKEGRLILPKVTSTDAGLYKWMFLTEGKHVDGKDLNLCVLGMVSKPIVKVQCDKKRVQLNCTVNQPDGVTYEWFEGSGVILNQNAPILIRTSKQLGSNSFFCNVSNRVSSQRSDPVQLDCFKTPPPVSPESPLSPNSPDEDDANLLFGLDFWLMVGILAGGGGLVLVLIVATIVCYSVNRKKRRIKDEQELRLQWATGTGTNQRPHNPQYVNQRSHAHPQGHSPRPGTGPPMEPPTGPTQGPPRYAAGNTGPRPSKARQNRPRPPDPITGQPLPGPRRLPQTGQTQIPVNEEENPPPLPQPRKKGPRRTQKQ